jgi:hypothetical protein
VRKIRLIRSLTSADVANGRDKECRGGILSLAKDLIFFPLPLRERARVRGIILGSVSLLVMPPV